MKFTAEQIDYIAELKDQAYVQGQRRTAITLLSTLLRELYPDTDFIDAEKNLIKLASLIKEREEIIGSLRSVCEDFGDNEWDEKLWLPDVIDKHLAKHLHND